MARPTKEEQNRKDELLAKGLKVCSKCGRVLPVEQFGKRTANKDGFNNQCKECLNTRYQENKEKIKQYYQENKEKIKQYYQENKEQKLKYQNQYYQENKEQILQYWQENKEKKQQYMKQYRQQYNQKHKEQILQYNQQYNQKHKEERQQYMKQYYQTPQGQVVRFNVHAKRRQREETQGNGITKEQWLEMMNFFNWKCAYSGVSLSKNNRNIDHIIPLAGGGEHEIWNCVPMYANYNFSKKDKDMMEWYTVQDFYSKQRLDKILEWQQYAYNKWSNQEQNIKIKEI